MIDPKTRPSKLRSGAAVVAGVVVIFILSLGTDVLMHATGIFPPWFQPMNTPLWIVALAYRIVYGVIGGYVTASFARLRPMAHAVALGIVGVVLSTMGVVGTWNKGPEFGPKWYPISLVLISLPCAWLGGKIWTMQRSN
jgi:hypothetical protein